MTGSTEEGDLPAGPLCGCATWESDTRWDSASSSMDWGRWQHGACVLQAETTAGGEGAQETFRRGRWAPALHPAGAHVHTAPSRSGQAGLQPDFKGQHALSTPRAFLASNSVTSGAPSCTVASADGCHEMSAPGAGPGCTGRQDAASCRGARPRASVHAAPSAS